MSVTTEPSFSPKVSVITPSYNQGKFIEKTILSVICQNYSNLEYVVVDAVSTDQTQQILKQYQSSIDCLIIEPDKGQTDALNKGFAWCHGEIMAYLNSDDCYASERVISKVVKHFYENPDIDVIYGQRNCINEKGFFTYCSPYRPFCKESLYLSDYIPQECVFWRRRIYEKAGAYVDDSFNFAMDYELWLRFLEHDAKFLSVEDFFGLFRSYQQQKSIDLWQTVGLPEIARLHSLYLKRMLPEQEMVDFYQQYFLGVHPVLAVDAFKFAQRLWGSFTVHKREILAKTPLDGWSTQLYTKRQHRLISLTEQT